MTDTRVTITAERYAELLECERRLKEYGKLPEQQERALMDTYLGALVRNMQPGIIDKRTNGGFKVKLHDGGEFGAYELLEHALEASGTTI